MTMQKAKPPKITGDQRLRAPVPPGITSWTDINTGPGDDVAQNVAAANDAVIEHLSNLCVELGLGMSISFTRLIPFSTLLTTASS